MNESFIAYKGFDKDLKCRGFQYKIGETYTQEEPPRVCGKGFHFCFKLEDCFNYYAKDIDNRYCEVEILGEYKRQEDKGSTKAIKILREIDPKRCLIEKEINKFHELSKEFPDLVLGGSLSLMIQNVISINYVGDIDVVGHRYHEFKNSTITRESSSQDEDAVKVRLSSGETIDFFIIPQVIYRTVEYDGKIIKVQSPTQIIEAKLKYFHKGIQKHKDAIIEYLNGPKGTVFNVTETVDQDLPF